jgi:pyridinium-3,5-bisthiocarboxylic acid mononucleotide nickel chelatase
MFLVVNADNITGEGLPYLIEGLMERGASSVHAVPAITKKGRSEFVFFIDAPRSCLEELGAFLALELDTLGMRVLEPEHFPFTPVKHSVVRIASRDREENFAEVRIKILAGTSEAVVSCKAEYDDLEAALRKFNPDSSISFKNFKAAVELACMSGEPVNVCGLVFSMRDETSR